MAISQRRRVMETKRLLPILAVLLSPAAYAASPTDGAVQSVWKPIAIKYSYIGYVTAYECDSFERKVRSILLAVGAAPQTRVKANGCIGTRPSRNFFVTVTTATPTPASEAKEPEDKATKELTERLTGVKDPLRTDPFPAQWKTVDLSRDRRLNLEPGDCELLEGLSKEVLPKLSVNIVTNRVTCAPNTL